MRRIFQLTFLFFFIIAADLLPQWTGVTSPTSDRLRKVQFLNNDLGWIAGESSVLKTTDGGTTWTSFTTNISDTRGFFAVSASTAFICGTFGKISKTTDGGATWVAQTTGAPNLTSIEAIFFQNENNGWAVGTDGFMIKTINGGTSWQTVTTTAASTLRSIKFLDNNIGWAGGGTSFLRTTDGGVTWTKINGFAEVRDIHFLDANRGFVSETWGQDNFVQKTTDGGVTWTQSTTISTGPYYFHGVYFTDANTGYVVGRTMFFLGNYGAYKTTDGGTTWTALTASPVPMFENFRSVTFTPNGTGWAVGDNGAIYKLADATSVAEESGSPVDFTLDQNYPNPFNPETVIRFALPVAGNVTLTVYNSLGEVVATLVDQFVEAGAHEVAFNAANLPSGTYIYKLNAGNFTSVKKMLLLK